MDKKTNKPKLTISRLLDEFDGVPLDLNAYEKWIESDTRKPEDSYPGWCVYNLHSHGIIVAITAMKLANGGYAISNHTRLYL